MADVTQKPITKRTAVAMARVFMKKETMKQIRNLPKGDAISCAKIAGIMAAKSVPSLIPMCHPLEITNVSVDIKLGKAVDPALSTAKDNSVIRKGWVDPALSTAKDNSVIRKGWVDIKSTVSCLGRTGVEMEALTSAAVAALTIYDMCKPVDKKMVIGDIMLLKKTGGKSGDQSYIHIKKERD